MIVRIEPRAEAAATETWVAAGKVADLADGAFLAPDGQQFVVSRSGKTVTALSTKCTHKSCAVSPVKTKAGTLKCKCHRAEYDLGGNVTKAPAELPLPRYPLRIKDGKIEVNTAATVAVDDKSATATIE